jgi:hypothetical protein
LIDIRMRAAAPQRPLPDLPFHEYRVRDTSWAQFYRVATGFLLRFPDVVDIVISRDASYAEATPVPDVPAALVEHVLLNQVTPLAQSGQGATVLHASAVIVDEVSVAFLGPSGRGKSTLAANFACNGYPFIAEDALQLDLARSDIVAIPGHPSIRLRPDAESAVFAGDASLAQREETLSKTRFASGCALPFRSDPAKLHCVFVLGCETVQEPFVAQVSPSEALHQLIRNSFLLEVDDRTAMASHFAHLADVAERVPVFQLEFPRRFEVLAAVRQTVIDAAASL